MFRKRLNHNPVAGLWLTSDGIINAEIVGYAGFDWVIIDCQHGIASLGHIQTITQVLAQFPRVGVFVRIPSPKGEYVQQVLDIGVTGIVVPNVKTAEEVNTIVRLSRYPPIGDRSISTTMIRATRYGMKKSYMHNANEEVMVIVQIETNEALDHLDEIARVPGVTALFPGPKDLAASMGYAETSSQQVADAIFLVEQTTKQNGLLLAGGATSMKEVKDLLQRGYTMLTLGADVAILASTLQILQQDFDKEVTSHVP